MLELTFTDRKDSKADAVLPAQPALTLVSRELRAETLKLYYSSNIFVFTDSVLALDRLRTFKTHRATGLQFIREIRVAHRKRLEYANDGSPSCKEHWRGTCSIKFKATRRRSRIAINGLQTSGWLGSGDHWKDRPCCCFLYKLCRWPRKRYTLINLLADFVQRIDDAAKVLEGECRKCGGAMAVEDGAQDVVDQSQVKRNPRRLTRGCA